jgi:Brp/Blh family beta-carotene 15,15'-monooxygenase
MLGFISGYLLLVGFYLGLWFVVPALAFAVFIAMTWFHWGQGDLHTLLALSPTQYLDSKSKRALALFIRGGFPMLVPFLAFPAAYQAEVQHLIQIFDQTAIQQLEWIFTPAFKWSLGGLFAGVVLISLGLNLQSAWSQHDLSAWSIDAIECLLLAIFFSTVPPVLAIGVYFCLWHATRHIARLMLIDPGAAQALKTRRFHSALTRFFRDAWPMTTGALLILGGLFYIIPDATATLRDSVAVYLALIAALTFPHIVVVSWMDRQQGVWRESTSNREM